MCGTRREGNPEAERAQGIGGQNMVVSRKTTANPIRYGMRMLVAGCRSLSHPPEDKHKYSGMQSIFEPP